MERPKRFGIVLRDLLLEREEFLTASGNVNLQLFARELPTYHYETLRKAVTGERQPSIELMQEVARVLRVEPDIFYEYGLQLAARSFDVEAVGLDAALENLRLWARARAARGGEESGGGKSRRQRGRLTPAPV